jgi:hypothetical protein
MSGQAQFHCHGQNQSKNNTLFYPLCPQKKMGGLFFYFFKKMLNCFYKVNKNKKNEEKNIYSARLFFVCTQRAPSKGVSTSSSCPTTA